jgi:D-3-phosphoglycerate dehydrogenase
MNLSKNSKIAVTSRSFSKSEILRSRITETFSDVQFNETGESLFGTALSDFLSGCEAAIVALEEIDEKLLSKCNKLKFISKYGVGLNSIDFQALNKYKVELLLSPGTNSYSVAELSIASAISLMHLVPQHQDILRNGGWKQEKGREFKGKKIGVVGCGSVGKEFLKIASYFGTELAAFDLNPDQEFLNKYNVQILTIQEIFRVSDVVSIHLPLTQETNGLIGAELLAHMKKDAIILNFSRGGIVNETDLINHLENNKFAGAAVDVFEVEPSFKSRLFELSNVIATPHIGGSTEESIMAMGNSAIDKLVEKVV